MEIDRELYRYIAEELLQGIEISYDAKDNIVFNIGNVGFTYEGRGHAVAEQKMFTVFQEVLIEQVKIFVKKVGSFLQANRKNLN